MGLMKSFLPISVALKPSAVSKPAMPNLPKGMKLLSNQIENVEFIGKFGRVLIAGTDLHGKLSFWGKPLLTDDEIRDWRARLVALKTFTEGLTP